MVGEDTETVREGLVVVVVVGEDTVREIFAEEETDAETARASVPASGLAGERTGGSERLPRAMEGGLRGGIGGAFVGDGGFLPR